MAIGLLPISLHNHFVPRPQIPTPLPSHLHNKCRSFCTARISQSSSSWEREETRWLREEQRWIREEQRWLREESRWNSEREALLCEIAGLRMRVDALERDKFSGLDVLRRNPSPQHVLVEEADVKEMVLEQVRVEATVEEEEKKETRRRTLRKGSEGADVRAMQEALEKLGFYSGEEDMEYSSFSSGTERAVKTWQASLGTREDGIMSSELLEKLFLGPVGGDSDSKIKSDPADDKFSGTGRGSLNGTPTASVIETAEFQQTVVKDDGINEVETSHHRVFLLGENRWEDPSRLLDKNRPVRGRNSPASVKCLTCRGEGRLLCTECDGTGEPNIEPQFIEWVDEGMKCPYCEGLGYTICDVCAGKTVVKK